MKRKLWIDLETYCEADLRKVGSYKYFEHESFEITLVAWAFDDDDVQVFDCTDGDPWPRELTDAMDCQNTILMAHNAMFDRVALKAYGFACAQSASRWFCTMVAANLNQLPAGLDQLGAALGLKPDYQKLKRGNELVRLFCKPRPANHKLHRATKDTHPNEWQEFIEYARQDIVAMRECYRKMPKWSLSAREVELWRLDQLINDRGVYIDDELCQAAVESATKLKKHFAGQAMHLTDGEVKSTQQVDKLLTHVLEFYGVALPNLQASGIEKRIEDDSLPEDLRDLLRARLSASKTTHTKFQKGLDIRCSDGRARGMYAFAAAERTCRWAGRLLQPQNLMRTPKYLHNKLGEAVSVVKSGLVHDLYDDPMNVIGACARPMLRAAPGKKLIVVDLSNIEGRSLAWEAGEEWRLQAFRDLDNGQGEDLYVLGYSRSFGVPIEVVKQDEREGGKMRLTGKVQELALGYQGAVGAFNSMAALYDAQLEDKEALKVVKAWRKASPNIVSWWYELEDTVRRALANPGEAFDSRCVSIQMVGKWLRVRLPSGRYLNYPGARLNHKDKIDFLGRNRYTRKWERIGLYGGRLAQGITQAIARDVLAHNMPAVEAAGYSLIGTVHDELKTETPDTDRYSVDELVELTTQLPPWAKGLPLAAKGYESYFYLKD